MKLTQRKIEQMTVERGQKDRLVFDEEQRGLAVRVSAGGGRGYLAQYTLHGQKHRIPLGACSALSLAKAREAAATIMGDVAKGKHPAAERKEAAAAAQAKAAQGKLTLETLIEDWRRLHLVHRRPRYAAEAVRALRYAFVRHLNCPAEDLDRPTVVRALDALTRKGSPKGAADAGHGVGITRGTAAYGRAAFGWALKRGAVKDNPFADLPNVTKTLTRDRVLTDDELAAIWRAAGEVSSSNYGEIVRMLILTGQRKDEVAGMTWHEISDDLATWTIPAGRTKNGAAHIVPLNDPARRLLHKLLPDNRREAKRDPAEQGDQSTLVLPGARGAYGGWSRSKAQLDAECDVHGWRLHDLRRTLATGLQRLGVRLEVTEAILNHVSGSRAGIVGIYQRHDWADEKRAALDAWGAHLMGITSGAGAPAKVVKMPQRAR